MKKTSLLILLILVGCDSNYHKKRDEFKDCMNGSQSSEKFIQCKKYIDFIFKG